MKMMIILPLTGLLWAGCTGNPANEDQHDSVTVHTHTAIAEKDNNTSKSREPLASLSECFQFIAARDTYDIRLNREGDILSGQMVFDHYEKDDSRGSISGKATGDTLKLVYRFQSEGMSSSREIYLKKDGDRLITGTGEEAVLGDSAYIKNPAALSFNGPVYEKVKCN